MARLSMSDIWDETTRFLGREKGLLLPIGFATFGVAMLLMGLVAPEGTDGQVPAGPWMIWMLPAFLLVTLGYLATSAVALLPNISVREALGVAMARLPSAVLIGCMFVGAMLLMLMVVTLLMAVVGAGLNWSMQQAAVASLFVAIIPFVWASIRLVALWPLLVDRKPGPVEAFGKSFALTAGHAGRIAGVMLMAGAVYLLCTAVAQLAGGSLFLLLGRAMGRPELAHTLSAILVAAVGATLATIWSLFVALLYRRLAGSSNGT